MSAAVFPTSDVIALHARRRPDAVAIEAGPARLTYAGLHAQVTQATAALAALALQRGSLVAISVAEAYFELLLMIVVDALDCIVEIVSLPGPDGQPALPTDVALVLSSASAAHVAGVRVLLADAAWWRATVTASKGAVPNSRGRRDPDALVRVLHSSGTTGRPKRMVITRRQFDARLRQRARLLGLDRTARTLHVLPFAVLGETLAVMACLRLGSTVVLSRAGDAATDLAERRITHTTLLPYVLEGLLRDRSARETMTPGLRVAVIGGAVASGMRAAVLKRLRGEIISIYSSNEAGHHGMVRPDGAVDRAHGTELQIVSENGDPVPPGSAGYVRVRGVEVVAGYLDDGLGRARSFVEGWFVSDDLAVQSADGPLRLLGREGDVVNLGGVKVPCAGVEERILAALSAASLAVREVAIAMRDDVDTGQAMLVCVVAEPGFDLNAAQRNLQPLLGGTFELHRLATIPRTASGKVRRRALLELSGG